MCYVMITVDRVSPSTTHKWNPHANTQANVCCWFVWVPGRASCSRFTADLLIGGGSPNYFLFTYALLIRWRIQGGAPSRDPHFFTFMQFSVINLQSNRLVHPLWELTPPPQDNPVSATVRSYLASHGPRWSLCRGRTPILRKKTAK